MIFNSRALIQKILAEYPYLFSPSYMGHGMYKDFDGIYASTIVPMHDDQSIDTDSLARHLREVSSVEGMRGLLVNGHAGENFTLSAEEKRTVTVAARKALGSERKLISGIYAESTAQACAEAKSAEADGADAILVFPPFSWALPQGKETIVAYHQEVVRQTNIPIMLYQASIGAGYLSYPQDVLLDLLKLDRVAAIKEGSWETSRYEANFRFAQRNAPDVRVMPSGDEHLLTTLILGGHGSQVSIAAVIPEVVVSLKNAVEQGYLGQALAAHNIIYPLAKAIYGAEPPSRATARLKACLYLLGRIPNLSMRAPMTASDEEELVVLRQALEAAGVLT